MRRDAQTVMPRFTTAVFDLDGTLADTLPLIYLAFNEALEPALGRSMSGEEIRSKFGPPDNHIIATMLPGQSGDEAFARYVAAYEREHERLVTAFNGIEKVTRLASEAGMKLGVVTGKSRQTALFTLQAVGLLRYFPVVYAGAAVARPKPGAEAVTKILADLGHDPGTAGAFIGDSAADVIAGRAAGLTTIAATWGSPDHDELFASKPDIVVNTTDELIAALGLG